MSEKFLRFYQKCRVALSTSEGPSSRTQAGCNPELVAALWRGALDAPRSICCGAVQIGMIFRDAEARVGKVFNHCLAAVTPRYRGKTYLLLNNYFD